MTHLTLTTWFQGSESQTEKAGPATSALPSSPLLSTLPLAEPWGPWHRHLHEMGLGTLPSLYPDSLSQEKLVVCKGFMLISMGKATRGDTTHLQHGEVTKVKEMCGLLT